jgi:hypothetical protein
MGRCGGGVAGSKSWPPELPQAAKTKAVVITYIRAFKMTISC